MRAAYTGTEALTFSQYIDLDTGKTLTAEPGGVYDIAPASGHVVDDVPAPWFTAVASLSWDTLELARELAPDPEQPEDPEG